MKLKRKTRLFYLKKQFSMLLVLALFLTTVSPVNTINSAAAVEGISKTEDIQTLGIKATLSNALEEEFEWKSEDFTYEEITEKLISTNHYYAITGLSTKGKIKIIKNKALVIPDRAEVMEKGKLVEKLITGIGKDAFADKDIESVKINVPEGYNEYIIAAGAFEKNKLTEIDIPYGVKFIESYAFRDNAIESLYIPKTVLKLGNGSFASNNISDLTISDEVEMFQFDSFSFSNNKLREVHLPYSIFKLLKNVFINNTGYENGKVLLYTRNKKHLETSTYIQPHSDYHEFKFMGEAVEREKLHKLIKEATALELSDYTKESRQVLEERLAAAKSTFSNETATQEDIDTAEANLKEAMALLKTEGVNKRELDKNIKRIKERNISPLLYTEESYNALMNALTKAEGVFLDTLASQETVNTSLDELLSCENALTIGEEAKYKTEDFTFDKEKITGFSESGKAKFEYNKDLIIPKKNENGEVITEIADSAFEYTKNDYIIRTDTGYSPNGLDSVVIPESIKKIGAKAFKYNKIKEVKLPSELEYIGSLAFNGNQLISIEIPDSVTDIGEGAFSLNKISHAKLSNGMEKIAPGIFARNIELEHIELPSTTKVIGKAAFTGCPITEIVIPNGVEKIEERAFLSHRIETLYIPASVKVIEREAFASNKKFRYLKYIKLSEGIEEVGSNAFKSGLVEEVDIPLSLKKLAKDAFNDNINSQKDVIKTKIYSVSSEQIELLKNKANKHELVLKDIDLSKLIKLIERAENLKTSYKYQNASDEKKTDFDRTLEEAVKTKDNPVSQANVAVHIYNLEQSIDNLDGAFHKDDKGKEDNNQDTIKPNEPKKEPDKKQEEKIEEDKKKEDTSTEDKKQEDKKEENNKPNNNSDSGRSYSSSGSVRLGSSSKLKPRKKEKEGTWQQDTKGWWYKHKDNSYTKSDWELVDDKWYYFNEEGYMFTGWLNKDGKWYYLEPSKTGEGSMVQGWQSINTKWYYFDESGAMLSSTTVSGYRLGKDGAYIE